MLWPLLQVLRRQKMHIFGAQQWQHGLIHARVSGRVPVFQAQQGNTARIHGRVLWPCSLLPKIFKKLILSSFCVFYTQDAFWTIF